MELLEFRFLAPTQVSKFVHQNHPSQTCRICGLQCEAAPAPEQKAGI